MIAIFIKRQLVPLLAILNGIANRYLSFTFAVSLPRTAIRKGALKLFEKEFQRRDETYKILLSF